MHMQKLFYQRRHKWYVDSNDKWDTEKTHWWMSWLRRSFGACWAQYQETHKSYAVPKVRSTSFLQTSSLWWLEILQSH